jgi:hypothetical protein
MKSKELTMFNAHRFAPNLKVSPQLPVINSNLVYLSSTIYLEEYLQ